MPPKQPLSKKQKEAKQKQSLEDQTFGLKNKNKSAKVQQFVKQVQLSAKNNSVDKNAEKLKAQKADKKLAKQLEEEEMRLLFAEGIQGQFGKNKKEQAKKAEALGVAKAEDGIEQLIEERFGDSDTDSDSDYDDYDGANYYTEQEIVATEIFREKTAEDIIEEQRAKFLAEGKTGTPVTEASFTIWRKAKLAKRQQEAEARALAELSKKKGSKGLSVLSGKELFQFNKDLFVDDEGAVNTADEDEMEKEMQALREAEERLAQEEIERAQKLQEQLREAEELEEAYRTRRIEEWRYAAAQEDKATFLFGDVTVNEIIFVGYDADEKEDLDKFPDPNEQKEIDPTEEQEEVGAGRDEVDKQAL